MFLDLLRLIRSGFRGDLPSRFILKKKLTGPGSDPTGEGISISFGPSSFYSWDFDDRSDNKGGDIYAGKVGGSTTSEKELKHQENSRRRPRNAYERFAL